MTLQEQGITINVMAPEPEQRFIIKENLDWPAALELALQNRKCHPNEPIELIPGDLGWQVVRVVK